MAKTNKAVMTPTQKAAQTAVKKADEVKKPVEEQKPLYAFPHCVHHHPDCEELNKIAGGKGTYLPALTVEDAKKLLGWETEADYVANLKTVDASLNEDIAKEVFAKERFLTDKLGNPVRLKNNTRNRPWTEAVTEAYVQDILNKHWEFNGETVIVGKYGRILSGQHRLIALIFAEQLRSGESEKIHWEEMGWTGPVTIPALIEYGVDESSKVTRTIDNVKSRTLTDVIIADTDLFGSFKGTERKSVARALEYAVKMMWLRTGVGDKSKDSFAPRRTHNEALAFVDRHPALKDCVKHILQLEIAGKEVGRVSRFIYLGQAAALMYMMGTTGVAEKHLDDYSDPKNRPPSEKHLKFPQMQKAKLFWMELANASASMGDLIMARCPVAGDDLEMGMRGYVYPTMLNGKKTGGNGSYDEQLGTIILAWNKFVKDEPIEAIELTYNAIKDAATGENMAFEMIEFPKIENSIDLGKKIKEKKADKATPSDETGIVETVGEGGPSEVDESDEPVEDGSDIDEADLPRIPNPSAENRAAWVRDKKDYDGHVLVYQSPMANSDNHIVMFEDAQLWEEITGNKVSPHSQTGVPRSIIPAKNFDMECGKVVAGGYSLLIISRQDKEGKRVIKPYASPETPASTPETPGKPVLIRRK